ncbi:lipocalin family protein [Flavobacterium hauense]
MFSAVLLGLTAVSCGDDDSSSATGGELKGKWIYAKDGVSVGGKDQLIDHVHTEGCDKDYMEITADEVKDVEYDKVDGACKEYVYEPSKYTRNGNTITVTEGTETFTATIEKLTSTELRIVDTETEGGVTVKYVSTYTRK